jgi:hypothetical protein
MADKRGWSGKTSEHAMVCTPDPVPSVRSESGYAAGDVEMARKGKSTEEIIAF